MSLRIYNTLTRKKEIFETLEPNQVRMYVCGPTVYSKAHVGHAMSALVFDIIRRYLSYKGMKVKHAMNYTDVDDKIIIKANEANVDPFELGRGYINEFQQHLEDLNILPATINPLATEEIPNIIEMVAGLIERGYAYPVDGDVYFRVKEFEGYGKLSRRRLEDMLAGTRVDVDTRKENQADFALWKAAKPGEPAWESPWGLGRPGWHIECSAMSLNHLGEQIDIHGGGNDLVFPHHENEIAQSEAYTGKSFATYWIHNGMLQLSGEKMSKSLGNLVTIEDYLENHCADSLRFMVLTSGYRSPLTFNDTVIEQSENGLERLRSALKAALPESTGAPQPTLDNLKAQFEATEKGFIESMDDDFNSAGALGHLFDLVRMINQARADGATNAELETTQNMLRELTAVFGLTLDNGTEGGQEAAPFIEMLINLRLQLRKEKLYQLADQIRDDLTEQGIVLEDSKAGTTWYWK
jgi:cysteinyl-tRNA synthetase